jgi:hypothetical protein
MSLCTFKELKVSRHAENMSEIIAGAKDDVVKVTFRFRDEIAFTRTFTRNIIK